MLSGLVLAVIAVAGPFAGAEEHVITGSGAEHVAASWALLAFLTERWTDQPQRWAKVPAVVMALAAATILLIAPTGNQARLGVAPGGRRLGRLDARSLTPRTAQPGPCPGAVPGVRRACAVCCRRRL